MLNHYRQEWYKTSVNYQIERILAAHTQCHDISEFHPAKSRLCMNHRFPSPVNKRERRKGKHSKIRRQSIIAQLLSRLPQHTRLFQLMSYMFSLNTDRRSVGLLSALPLLFLGFATPVSIGRGLTPRKLEPASSSNGFRPPGPDAGLLLALRPRSSSSSKPRPPDNPGVAARFML